MMEGTRKALSKKRLNEAMVSLSKLAAAALAEENVTLHEVAQTGAIACAYILDLKDKQKEAHDGR